MCCLYSTNIVTWQLDVTEGSQRYADDFQIASSFQTIENLSAGFTYFFFGGAGEKFMEERQGGQLNSTNVKDQTLEESDIAVFSCPGATLVR